MSRGQSQRRTDSRKRPLERCKSKGKPDDMTDVDRDKIPDVIIIDPPEPSEWTSLDTWTSGKDKAPAYRNIICIDDDDDDDESGDRGSPQNSRGEIGNQDSHFTSSNNSHANHNQGRKSSSKSLKHRGNCSRETSSLNQQKFTPGTSFEDDDTDCDIAEGYLGNIRQQWEKASLRKKTFVNVHKVKSGSQDEAIAMGFNTYSQNHVDVDETAEAPILSGSNNSNHDKGNLSPAACAGEAVVGDSDTSNKSDGENHHMNLQETTQQEICHKINCSTEAVNEMVSESISNTPPQVKSNPLVLVTNGVGPSDVQNYIIVGREMLKKTDAYKRAEEEEWALRQKELQIQAEEARRLRKRRKAETLRLLEMERRQKQRVEEVREAQKKDEETSTLKEEARVEIRRELNKLEADCGDMAALLRGLGIIVEGGLHPRPSEVRAAYKQAQFKFHPDRSASKDIRQQIEAEEKFKLIARAKEKFVL